MLEYCADQGIAAVCHGSLLGGFLRYASMSRSLLPYNLSLLPYNRSLLPFNRSLLPFNRSLLLYE